MHQGDNPRRKSRFSESQIITILKAFEAGRTVKDVCREHGVSEVTYYNWKSKLTALCLSDWAKEHIVKLEFIKPGKLTRNGYGEGSTERIELKCWTAICLATWMKSEALQVAGWESTTKNDHTNHSGS